VIARVWHAKDLSSRNPTYFEFDFAKPNRTFSGFGSPSTASAALWRATSLAEGRYDPSPNRDDVLGRKTGASFPTMSGSRARKGRSYQGSGGSKSRCECGLRERSVRVGCEGWSGRCVKCDEFRAAASHTRPAVVTCAPDAEAHGARPLSTAVPDHAVPSSCPSLRVGLLTFLSELAGAPSRRRWTVPLRTRAVRVGRTRQLTLFPHRSDDRGPR
jgi:hypothetical protein